MLRTHATPRRLAFVFLLPFVFGLLQGIVLKPTHWFADFEAMSCSGHALNSGQAIYGAAPGCPDADPTRYVYTPEAARLIAAWQRVFGVAALTALYGGVYWVVIAQVFRRLLADDGRLRARGPFLACMSASALHSGNISIVIHGLLFLGIRVLGAWPVPAMLALALAAIVKPTFGTYFALFLFLKRPVWQRLALAGGGGLIVAGYLLYFHAADPDLFAQWRQIGQFYGLVEQRGLSFLGLPWIGGIPASAALGVLYLAFAATLLAAGLAVASRCLPSETDRLLLGLSVGLLLYPRLMTYDLYTLPFGLAVAVSGFAGLGWLTHRRLIGAIQVLAPVFGLIGGRMGGRLLFDASCVLLLVLAGAALARPPDAWLLRRSKVRNSA